jgi:mRNA interferase MazF
MSESLPQRGEVWTVNFAQILTVDKSRLLHRMGALSSERMEMVNSAIKVSLDVG